MGPALFALELDELTREVESDYNIWYLDDATLGGSPDVVLRDVRRLVTALGVIGLEVKSAKCELTVIGHADVDPVLTQFREVIPDVRLVELDRFGAAWCSGRGFGYPADLGREDGGSGASCFAVAGG